MVVSLIIGIHGTRYCDVVCPTVQARLEQSPCNERKPHSLRGRVQRAGPYQCMVGHTIHQTQPHINLCKLSFLELDISYISCIYFTLLITFQQHGGEVSSRTYQWHSRLFLLLSALWHSLCRHSGPPLSVDWPSLLSRSIIHRTCLHGACINIYKHELKCVNSMHVGYGGRGRANKPGKHTW